MTLRNPIIFPPENQFHCLIHFSNVDDVYYNTLTQQGYTENEIFTQLDAVRSKFHYDFASNPMELFEKIEIKISESYKIVEVSENKLVISLKWDQTIGNQNILQVSSLSDKQKNTLHQTNINGEHFWKVEANPTKTKVLQLILHTAENHLEIKTVFPGIYAPPFPNHNEQDKELYNKSRAFWDNHAFIIKPDKLKNYGNK